MDVSDYEYATITITPASMTKRKRFAQKRAAQLAKIERDGWQIVDTEPERFLRPGDKVTVKREKRQASDAPLVRRESGILGWWDSLDSTAQIGYGLGALAIVVSVIALLA